MKRILPIAALYLISFAAAAQNYNVGFVARLNLGSRLSSLWGYVDKTGREYALVGRENGGISIVDVSDAQPVEVFRSTGPPSPWREIKVYNHHAYVVTEVGVGMQIIDLSSLPENRNLPVKMFTESGKFSTAHTLWIDEDGLLYLWGSNRMSGRRGYAVYDLKPDPKVPQLLYSRDTPYVHDGITIGNRMYLSHINDGYFTVFDITDKSNPILLGQQETPNQYTHNAWPSGDGKYLFTTDERRNSYLAAYDISTPFNYNEVDRIQTNPGSQAIIHNVHILGNYAISSYYTEGITIHDVSEPDNLVEVGKYDTSPLSGGEFAGTWEVYPFFPSGKLIAGDMELGLFVLMPVYRQACYLQGTVYDAIDGQTIPGVTVTLNGLNITDRTALDGVYKTGYGREGLYSATFSKEGYRPVTIADIPLKSGEKHFLNVRLQRDITGIYNSGNAVFEIYPNPSAGAITVVSSSSVNVEVFDHTGRVMLQAVVPAGENRLAGFEELPKGSYLLKAATRVVKVMKY